MDEVANPRRSPKPFFTLAAWFSLLGPMLAAGLYYYAVPAQRGEFIADPELGGMVELRRREKVGLVVLAVVFAVAFAAGCVSLRGVRTNGALVILPPALLGILVSAVLEVLALFFLALTGLPGP